MEKQAFVVTWRNRNTSVADGEDLSKSALNQAQIQVGI